MDKEGGRLKIKGRQRISVQEFGQAKLGKAFDPVNWTFLNTLHKFGSRELFIHWIMTLFTSPKDTVTTNGIISSANR